MSISTVLGAAVQTASPTRALSRESASLKNTVAPMVVGGIAGSFAWKRHPWLGALAGIALGSAVDPLLHGDGQARLEALAGLAAVGGGVAASLKWKSHPAWAYVGGVLGAGLLIESARGVA